MSLRDDFVDQLCDEVRDLGDYDEGRAKSVLVGVRQIEGHLDGAIQVIEDLIAWADREHLSIPLRILVDAGFVCPQTLANQPMNCKGQKQQP